MAPDFGEDDFEACKAAGIHVVLSVDNEGRFGPDVVSYAGQNIKEADPQIIKDIKGRGRLFKHATLQHSYPFCWRSGHRSFIRLFPHASFALKPCVNGWLNIINPFTGFLKP